MYFFYLKFDIKSSKNALLIIKSKLFLLILNTINEYLLLYEYIYKNLKLLCIYIYLLN